MDSSPADSKRIRSVADMFESKLSCCLALGKFHVLKIECEEVKKWYIHEMFSAFRYEMLTKKDR